MSVLTDYTSPFDFINLRIILFTFERKALHHVRLEKMRNKKVITIEPDALYHSSPKSARTLYAGSHYCQVFLNNKFNSRKYYFAGIFLLRISRTADTKL